MVSTLASTAVGSWYLWTWVALPLGIYGTVWIFIVACVARFIPEGTRVLSGAILQVHPELGESAGIAGGSPWNSFRRILVPLTRTGLWGR